MHVAGLDSIRETFWLESERRLEASTSKTNCSPGYLDFWAFFAVVFLAVTFLAADFVFPPVLVVFAFLLPKTLSQPVQNLGFVPVRTIGPPMLLNSI